MKLIKNIFWGLGILGIIISCKPEIEMPAPSGGGIDLNNFLAIGASLTAGYQDGGLYLEGQDK